MSSASENGQSALRRLPPQVLEQICRALLVRPLDEDSEDEDDDAEDSDDGDQLFHEPSLNVLWHTIPDIAVLFYTLPGDAYKRKYSKKNNLRLSGHRRFSFNDIPAASQLERFLDYARRVRRIDSEVVLSKRIENYSAAPSAYTTLARVLGPRVLFPNLEEIHYSPLRQPECTRIQVFRVLCVLFGPQLRALHVLDFDPSSVMEAQDLPPPTDKEQKSFALLWNKLINTAPQLQKLSMIIEPMGSSRTMVATASSAICHLEHLVSLELRSNACVLRPGALASLARLPQLSSLRCDIGASFRTSKFAARLAAGDGVGPPFPALRELEIAVPTLALPTDLLRFFQSPRLAKLTITALAYVPRSQVLPFFLAITRMRAQEHLRELHVKVERLRPTARLTEDVQSLPWPIGKETLAPLLLLPGLEVLGLNLRCRFDVDDELLELLARSWPRLECLSFRPTSPTSLGLPEAPEPPLVSDAPLMMLDGNPAMTWPRPRATLFGLRAFAQHCPQMRQVALEVDADMSRVLPSRLETCARPQYVPNGTLHLLSVGLSPIGDPYAVAAFLSDVFPAVREIYSDWGDVNDCQGDAGRFDDEWDDVQEYLPDFIAVRLQEGRWKQRVAARMS
ncbi:hypothetical protein VTO73DRAFT_5669 [Trametes versicolor]